MNNFEGHNFNKRLGQNFISDPNLLNGIADDAGISKDDFVLEIGAGAGTLTEILAQKAKFVLTYEVDKTLADSLHKTLDKYSNVQIEFADALTVSNSEIYDKFKTKYKIVANLPYYITTPLLLKFLDDCKNIKSITVTVQKEVAERINAQAGTKEYGAISALAQFDCDTQIKRIIDKSMFYPTPEVDSAVLNLIPKDKYISKANQNLYSKCIKTAFAMRRKTLANNLCEGFKIARAQAEEILSVCGFDKNVRGETLSVEDFITLTNAVQKILNIK